MSTLVSLPTEVLLVIIRHLPTQEDRLNLAKCNRRMYTQLQLEAAIRMELDPYYCAKRIKNLIGFLLSNTSIAGAVKSLKLGRMWICDRHRTSQQATARSIDSTLKFDPPSTQALQRWLDELFPADIPGAWQALVICLLPNIKYLEWVCDDPDTIFTDAMSLREVFFKVPLDVGRSSSNGNRAWSIAQLKHFFQTPSTRKIKAYGLIGTCPRLAPPDSSSISHVELHQSFLDFGFHELISPCTNLKSFKYFYSEDSAGYSWAPRFCMKSFMDAISPKAHSLETLYLNYLRARNFDTSSDESIGTFNEFRVLKYLQLPMHTFLELDDMEHPASEHDILDGISGSSLMPLARHLPSSLERLCVTQWWVEAPHGNMINQLVNLVRSRNEFPRLANVDIYGAFIKHLFTAGGDAERLQSHSTGFALFCPGIHEDYKRLSNACREMGVGLRVHNDP
ncbi:Cyclin-like F-box [Penicillium camemberti]|uniref:Cyclin-like F-box n=1 Tax=Penicillium camemberti (strain FM 013) TaxID=1429867 RepID=A0A0G4PA65_PENC3|nr:Cyclin-like F-box [Penicillium camemberti]